MKGYWNGEDATFKGVTYEVTEPDVPTWWQGQYVGQRRHGIEVTYGGSVWIIDNEHGDGFYKVTRGMGSPRCPHKSIHNPINVEHLDDSKINMILDIEGIKVEQEAHREWMKKNYPEDFKRSEALRKSINHKSK